MKKHKRKHGFTIIEVVLVLAIAGLIFLMVFIALPALQKAQRDRQRDNNISQILAALENYKTHNNGRYPGTIRTGKNKGRACFMQSGSGCNVLSELDDFMKRYVTEKVVDPSTGKPYHFSSAGIYGSSCKEGVTKSQEGGNLFRSYGYSTLAICYETKCDGKMSNAKDKNVITIYYNREFGGIVCKEI